MSGSRSTIAVVGDCHGHLQLALGVLAVWQRQLRLRFDAVFLCGDVGTFTEGAQLDNATRRHGRTNPCELEFLTQWSTRPPAPWLGLLFLREAEGGLGLDCPIVMVHGNHEGFAHLERLVPSGISPHSVHADELPAVDADGHIRLLPSGWRIRLAAGHVVAGVGGIERGHRTAEYHPMAYIDDDAVINLLEGYPATILLTHQGPSGVQGVKGSPTLQSLLDAGSARIWFHGHSTPNPEIVQAGPDGATTVVPLGDIAFPDRGPDVEEPGPHGWALVTIEGGAVSAERLVPPFLRDFRRNKWTRTSEGLLICPPLARAYARSEPPNRH